MDKHQELRTNLVLEANSALSAIRELSDGLDKISRLKFDNVKDGFKSLTKAFEAAQKMSTKVARVQSDDEKRFQNLLQQRAKIMKEMLDGYSKDRGFSKTEKWDGLRSQFESANIEIANFMKLSGRASEAVKYLQEALIAVANTPLYDPLKNQLAKLKVDLKSIKNDVNDRVSELDGTKQGKIDKVVSKELSKQADQQAKDHTAEQKAIADKVRATVNASKQAREAAEKTRQERAKARVEEAQAKAEQQKKDSEALQKYLGQKQAAYAKELEAEAKLARTRKENEEKRIEATKKRQELNEKEWNGVQAALGKMERDPHRNDLYKTTGDYYPEMNRRLRVQQEEINKAKELSAIKEANDKKELQRKKDIEKLMKDIAKLEKDIENHRGVNGQGYSKKAYDNTVNRIDNLQGRAKDLGLDGLATTLNASMLNGVNTKLGQFNNRLSEAKDKAQELYMRFQRTGAAADKLSFMKAVNELKQLEHISEDFNRQINKAARSALTLENIARRAREHFNWTAGAYVENAVLSFPNNLVETVSKYELAMAGIAQVIPKAEEGQAQLNSLFERFSDIAARYGQSVSDAMESAKSLGRMYGQGDGDHELGATNTKLLTAQAAKMATVDNFDMLAATKGLESALAQFNLQTEDTNLLMARSNKILDVWTKLAHTSGASTQDLTQGVNQAGSSAREAGVSFEFLNALIATGVRSTAKSGNEIGTTLKSMFASIQSDKAIKAMQKFGIEVYRMGQNGREMRPIKDIILDISRALSTTDKDTKEVNDFLLAVSGGKFQVSKIAAILGNYKELQRTMKEAGNSAGFTDKQLDLQMNTVSRKFETLKANIDKLFVASGSDGLANDLKWLLDVANRLATALQSSETHFYKWAKWGTAIFIAWKAVPSLFNALAAASGRFAASWNMVQSTSAKAGILSSVTGAWSTRMAASQDKYQRTKQTTPAGNAGIINLDTSAIERNTVAQSANTTAKKHGWSAYQRLNRIAITSAASTNKVGRAWISFSKILGHAPITIGAASNALTAMSFAWRGLGSAVAFCGGPLGAIVTAISLASLAWGYFAEKEQEATEASQKFADEVQHSIQISQDFVENLHSNTLAAQDLADEYNKLVDRQNELKQAYGDGVTQVKEYYDNEKRMGELKKAVAGVFHQSSVELNEDGKINRESIKKLSDAQREALRKDLEGKKVQLEQSKLTTDGIIEQNQRQIDSMKNLADSTSWVARAYVAMYNFISKEKSRHADNLGKQIEGLDDQIAEAEANGDTETVKELQENKAYFVKMQSQIRDEVEWRNNNDPGLTLYRDEIAKLSIENGKLVQENMKSSEALASIYAILGSDFTKTGLSAPTDPTETDVNAGKVHPESDAERKAREKEEKKAAREAAKAEKQKDIVSFRTDEVMDYVNTVSKETGTLPIGQLLSFAAALNGHNDPWQVQNDYYADKNIFKVPDWMTDKYAQGRKDEESRFWAFASWMKEHNNPDSQAGLMQYYKLVHPQASDEEVNAKASEWNNEGLYFDNKHNYGKDKSKMTHHSAYDLGALAGDVITGSQYDEFINQMAAAYGVDKVLAHQIAEQESTHGKGSSNVFQVQPETGREMGFSDMNDPLQSIEAGLKYFAKMLNESNGNVEQALRRYNGGGDPNYVANVLRHQYSPVSGSGNSSVWDEAVKHLGDKRIDYGAGDLAKECAAFVSTVLKDAGVEGLNSINVDRLRDQAEARGLYHSAGSGYQPKRGDVVIWGNHTGIVDGEGHYIARNSSGMHKGDVSEASSYGFGALQGYISTGAVAGRHPVYEWKNSANGGKPSLYNMEFSKQNTMEQWLKNREELFKLQEEEIKELDEQGKIAESLAQSSEVARNRSNTKAIYLTAIRDNVLKSYKEFIQKMTSDSDVNAVLKRNNMTISEVNPSDMDELINRMKNAGKATQEIERLWKVVKEFNFDSKGESIKLKQTEAEAWREKLNAAKADGYLNPAEEEDYALKALDLRYQQQTAGKLFQDPRAEESYHEARAEVYQHRLDRLQIEAQKADEDAPAEIERLKQKLLEAKEVRDNKKAALDNAKTPEETAKLTKELEDAQRYLDLQSETWRNVEQRGTQAQRKVAEETVKTKNELVKEQQAAHRVETELKQKLGNGIKSMFSDVLMEGKSFSESWKSLWTDIGKFALDRLLEIQLSRWGFDGIFGHAKGGKVAKKANGGLIPKYATGGYTNGLIRGAGTGTSDSILTYLAHRGQFIQTSNGEYIIKKSSVDRLGVGFLDTLNNNPDSIGAMAGLKRYATGGNLGESYAPSMSLKGVEAYRTFNRANLEKQQHFSTRKMEELQRQTIEAINSNQGDGAVAQPIILNTQADSASVMKAIAKNPRALQAILGNNQRRGFR